MVSVSHLLHPHGFFIVTRKSQKSQKFLPLNPWEAYANGAGKDIEFLQGCNRDEMRTFLGAIGVDRWNEWAKGRIEEKLALLTDEEKALVKSFNEAGLDFHAHTVGERSSRTVLDGVELAKKELGDNFRVKVTCAHLEI